MTWRANSLAKLRKVLEENCVENIKEDLQEEIKKHTEIAEDEILKALNKFLENTGLVPESVSFEYVRINPGESKPEYLPVDMTLKATT